MLSLEVPIKGLWFGLVVHQPVVTARVQRVFHVDERRGEAVAAIGLLSVGEITPFLRWKGLNQRRRIVRLRGTNQIGMSREPPADRRERH